MKTFNHSELGDFLEDETFRLWLLGKATPGLAQEWEEFPYRYPEKAATFRKAQETLRAIQGDTFVLPSAKVRQNIRQIMEAIEPVSVSQPVVWYQMPIWRWAAAAMVLLGVTWFSWQQNRLDANTSARLYQQLVATAESPLEEVTNTTFRSQLVMLSDGSSVLLQPNSRISYAKQFNQHTKREIYLTGEAFFEVAKNPEKPFFVYADNLITKVLGTSFTVRANGESEVDVIVKTGKVSVFTRSDKERVEKQQSKQLTGLVLTPNQRVQFDEVGNRLLRSLVDSPTVLDMPIQQSMFEFGNTPITQVFASLERAYGVEIVFDAEVMKNCYLTASLDDEPLFEKLNMICQTLDAQYEQMDGKILISSKGCQ
ncbi:FecR domain-containing protein [Spirosoma foliorum]|uniref:FecR domain-containing protein n=1 Tax=Spirosoma foliorum TaxID=2710596 RepID=A0A7G5GPE2_9BACT|nr:FecR domain-containing protein [Spirosoma foliorum]QMW00734.1 FecR domain-containing protein [Spirosoma foliorum]